MSSVFQQHIAALSDLSLAKIYNNSVLKNYAPKHLNLALLVTSHSIDQVRLAPVKITPSIQTFYATQQCDGKIPRGSKCCAMTAHRAAKQRARRNYAFTQVWHTSTPNCFASRNRTKIILYVKIKLTLSGRKAAKQCTAQHIRHLTMVPCYQINSRKQAPTSLITGHSNS